MTKEEIKRASKELYPTSFIRQLAFINGARWHQDKMQKEILKMIRKTKKGR